MQYDSLCARVEHTEVHHLQAQLKEEQRRNRNHEEQRLLEIEHLKKQYEDECQQNRELHNQLYEKDKQVILSKCRKDESEEMRRMRQEKERCVEKLVDYS